MGRRGKLVSLSFKRVFCTTSPRKAPTPLKTTATVGVVTLLALKSSYVLTVFVLMGTYGTLWVVAARYIVSSIEFSGLPVDVANANVSITSDKLDALTAAIEAQQNIITDGNFTLLPDIAKATSSMKARILAGDFECTLDEYSTLVAYQDKVKEWLNVLGPLHEKLHKVLRLSEEGSQIWASHPELHTNLDRLNATEPLVSDLLTLIHALTDLWGQIGHFLQIIT